MEPHGRAVTAGLGGGGRVEEQGGGRRGGPPVGFWKDSWIRLKKNRGALISLLIVILLFAIAFVIGPLLSQHSPYAQDPGRCLPSRYPARKRRTDACCSTFSRSLANTPTEKGRWCASGPSTVTRTTC